MNDPYDDDYRAPWNNPERPELGYLEEADYHEEHNDETFNTNEK
jgi:hypothetical protein